MSDLTTARECIREHLRQLEMRMNSFGSALPGYQNRPKHHLVVVSEQEYDFGWVFCYNTKEYMDSRNISHALAGNAPLIFDRRDGQVYVTGTAHTLDHYIEEYRKGIRRRAELDGKSN
jgi:hypothetical protein